MLVEIGIALALAASTAGLVHGSTGVHGQAAPESRITDAEILAARRVVYGPGFEHVEADGWNFTDSGTTMLVFTQPARQPRHIWSRWEKKTLGDGVRSSRRLDEVDCAGWRMRTVQITTFSEANLDGYLDSLDEPLEWSSPAPGTLGESLLEAACDR